jgi:hypothetical protein
MSSYKKKCSLCLFSVSHFFSLFRHVIFFMAILYILSDSPDRLRCPFLLIAFVVMLVSFSVDFFICALISFIYFHLLPAFFYFVVSHDILSEFIVCSFYDIGVLWCALSPFFKFSWLGQLIKNLCHSRGHSITIIFFLNKNQKLIFQDKLLNVKINYNSCINWVHLDGRWQQIGGCSFYRWVNSNSLLLIKHRECKIPNFVFMMIYLFLFSGRPQLQKNFRWADHLTEQEGKSMGLLHNNSDSIKFTELDSANGNTPSRQLATSQFEFEDDFWMFYLNIYIMNNQ